MLNMYLNCMLTIKQRNFNYHQNNLELFNIFQHFFTLNKARVEDAKKNSRVAEHWKTLDVVNIKETSKTLCDDYCTKNEVFH